MASDVKLLSESVKKLSSSITELLEMQKASELRQANMEKELQLLKVQNSALCAQNSLLKNAKASNDIQPSSPVNQKSLVIGSSLIKHFDESKLSNHAICCMPGAHMKHIDQKLKSVALSGVKYQSVTIVAGGSDASLPSDKVDLEETLVSLKSAIDTSKQLSDVVVLSAIPPRLSPNYALENIQILNAQFQCVASDMGVQYVSCDNHFYI